MCSPIEQDRENAASLEFRNPPLLTSPSPRLGRADWYLACGFSGHPGLSTAPAGRRADRRVRRLVDGNAAG